MIIKDQRDKVQGSIITKGLEGKVDYIDCFGILAGNAGHSIDYLTAMVFTSFYRFWWMKALFKLRNILVRPFGLKTDEIPGLEKIDPSMHYNIGDMAVFFNVLSRNDREIIMDGDDSHLYFRVSLLLYDDPSLKDRVLCLTTLVQFHNTLGRIYFTIIKPFHRIIMKRLLRSLPNVSKNKNRLALGI